MTPLLRLLSLVLALALPPTLAAAQETPAEPSEPAATDAPRRADVEKRIEELKGDDSLGDAEREDAQKIYGQVLDSLDRAASARGEALESERAAQEAPALLQNVKSELAKPPEPLPDPAPAETSLVELQRLQQAADGELRAAQKALDELEAEKRYRDQRRESLPEQIASAREAVAAAENVLVAGAAPTTPVQRANAELRRAKLEERRAELRRLESELSFLEARHDVLPARRDLAARRVERARAIVDARAKDLAERRQSDAAAAQTRVDELSASIRSSLLDSKALDDAVQEVSELAEQRAGEDGPAAKLEDVGEELNRLRAEVDETRARFERTREKVRKAGLSEAMGRILRGQYQGLADPASLERQREDYQERLADALLAELELEDELDEASDVERLVAELELEEGATRSEVESAAREVFNARQEMIEGLLTDYREYSDRLQKLDDLVGTYLELLEEIRTYIEERILWVRSIESDSFFGMLPDLSAALGALAWLIDPVDWTEAFVEASPDTGQWFVATLFATLAIVVGVARRPLRRWLAALAPLVARHKTDRYALTLRAALLTLLISLPVPLALVAAAKVLAELTDGRALVHAVAHALEQSALTLFPLFFLLAVLVPKGLAESHFRWPGKSVSTLRKLLRAATTFLVPFSFVYRTFGYHTNDAWSASIGRIAFVGLVGLVGVLAYRALAPRGKVLGEYLRRNETGLLERSRVFWYPATFVVPFALVLLALAGYFYTAEELYERTRMSYGLGLALVLLNAMMLRWLYVTRRRLAVAQAKLRAEARAAAEEGGEGGSGSSSVDEDRVDIPNLDAKTKQLFRSILVVSIAAGLYFVWSDTLPALKGLARVTVYPELAVRSAEALEKDVAQEAEAAASRSSPNGGGTELSTQSGPMTPASLAPSGGGSSSDASRGASGDGSAAQGGLVITLADIALALLVLGLTAVAAMNFPSLLEIGLLQRLPMDAGARYAATTVTTYLIVIAGISSTAGAVGVGWGQIQWLVAALTFGLAFGLQEIFANFVSGLIILFERPVRPGDIVTVGGIEGKVNRVRMRATTILDWDRRELIVPNKEFITTQLINWTLSDPVSRVIIPVGIAYGSDTRKAAELLLECARENPKVLEDPPPFALFRAFGSSSLDFELRYFLPHRDVYLEVLNGLHQSIDDAFREAGIEIAFPQRDLHVRSGLDVLTPRQRADAPSEGQDEGDETPRKNRQVEKGSRG